VNSIDKGTTARAHSYSRLTSSRSLLLTASVFHLGVCLAVLAAGRFGLMSSAFDSRGIGKSFAPDSVHYFTHALSLADVLKHDGLPSWWTASFPLHIRLYSLSLVALGPLTGSNILAVEPLNLLCYVSILWFVFKLGSEVFGRRAGLLSAIVIAIWPSFLLHTTQVLKDPLFIAVFLALVFFTTRLLTTSLNWKQGLREGLRCGGLAILLWLVKSDFWELSLLVVLVAVLFVLIRAIGEKAIMPGNLVALCLLISCSLAAPQLFNRYRKPNPHPLLTVTGSGSNQQITVAGAQGGVGVPPSRSSRGLTRLRERIAWARYLYANYPGAGSGIDTHVRFENWGQIVKYLPRALEIGLFAPFPTWWITGETQVGRSGKILSGFETLLMYLTYVFAAVGLYKSRALVPAWFLLAIAMSCLIVLSTVTANVGALYRLRYPFWMLLIVIGIYGAVALWDRLVRNREAV
jgi:hypothetical protein